MLLTLELKYGKILSNHLYGGYVLWNISRPLRPVICVTALRTAAAASARPLASPLARPLAVLQISSAKTPRSNFALLKCRQAQAAFFLV